MKGCLILQRNFAYIGHSLAILLKEKYNITDFCGYVYLRSGYNSLQSQKDIQYSALLLDEEIHQSYKNEKIDYQYLQNLEKEYGIPNLWPYLAVDRILMYNQLVREYPYQKSLFTHEEMLHLLQAHSKAIINMLDKEKPDFVFGSVVGGLGSFLLYQIAKKRGIKTLLVLPAGIDNRQIITEKYDRFTDAEKISQKIKDDTTNKAFLQAEQFLSEFRTKPKPYFPQITTLLQQTGRRAQLKISQPNYWLKSARWFFLILYKYLKNKKRDYSDTDNPWYFIVDRVKRKLRNLRGNNDLYDTFNPQEDYAFFPLHYEPEVALLVQAPFHCDQIYIIKQIARSLPVHFKLYVKEHPAMVESRPRSYYQEIKKNPNVKLINPAISGLKIIPTAKIIFTITGSSGWEAILLQKPVISFGHQFYNHLSMVKRCAEIEQLPFLVKTQLENFTYNEKELINFITAVIQDSIPLDLNHLWYEEYDMEKKKEGLRPLADLIARKLFI